MILGITGGIAAYKAAFLASLLTHLGVTVHAVMTRAATEFITPLTLQSLTKQPVYLDVFDERDPGAIAHIALADQASAIIVAPATADIIARVAHGLGDDMLTTILLAATCPVIFAPAMNVHMYENKIVQANLEILRQAGYHVAEPGVGPLACGYEGRGRLMEPPDIVEYLEMILTRKHFSGKSVLVTAGPTKERIDPVRFISNDSTGTMGYSLAQMAWRMGAKVTLVSGPVGIPAPIGVDLVKVESAQDMLDEVTRRLADADVVIKTAAVADFRPETVSSLKIKKQNRDALTLSLVKNPDILQHISHFKAKHTYVVGFAAETHDTDLYARKKLHEKDLDLLVLNDVLEEGAGFGTGTNRVTLYDRSGEVTEVPKAPKLEIAQSILMHVATKLQTP